VGMSGRGGIAGVERGAAAPSAAGLAKVGTIAAAEIALRKSLRLNLSILVYSISTRTVAHS